MVFILDLSHFCQVIIKPHSPHSHHWNYNHSYSLRNLHLDHRHRYLRDSLDLEFDVFLWEILIPKVDFITQVREDELCIDMGIDIVKSGIALSDASSLVPGKKLSKGWNALDKI